MMKRVNMLPIRKLVTSVVIGGIFLWISSANAIMRGDVKANSESQSETPKKAVENTNQLRRATELVLKIQDGVLYTDKNRYDLKGVKVIDHAEDAKVRWPSDGRKRVAEMIFLNDTLQEVIIHK